MSTYENYNMELLMSLKSEVEKRGHLPKGDALLLIQTCASLIIQNEDTYRKNLSWQLGETYKLEERMYH